jgi:hypothetical protein
VIGRQVVAAETGVEGMQGFDIVRAPGTVDLVKVDWADAYLLFVFCHLDAVATIGLNDLHLQVHHIFLYRFYALLLSCVW